MSLEKSKDSYFGDHPEFERIKHTLERAASMAEPVLSANHMHLVEGEAESWYTIKDVRPA